jgi:glutaredoxin
LTTLIELDGQESQYTYDLIINKERNDISIKFKPETRDIRSVVQDRLVLFVSPGCDHCDELSNALTERRITYKAFDIHKDPTMYRQFISFIERMLTSETKIKFPVIWNNDYAIFGYDDLETLITELESK